MHHHYLNTHHHPSSQHLLQTPPCHHHPFLNHPSPLNIYCKHHHTITTTSTTYQHPPPINTTPLTHLLSPSSGVLKSLEPLNSQLSQEVQMLTKYSEAQVLEGLTKAVHSRVGSSSPQTPNPYFNQSCIRLTVIFMLFQLVYLISFLCSLLAPSGVFFV